MSIRYIVGNPGSGKSYLGAKVLYDAFLRPKKQSIFFTLSAIIKAYKNDEKHKSIDEILKENEKKEHDYLVAYTNINEFKFNLSENIKKLDFDELLKNLSILFNQYKFDKESNDAKLIELAQELGLYKALFVIDEIHNFFDKDNEILRWWLTYHRHLYQEMYLITQDLDLVSNEYKKVAEFFYKAVDSSKRFFSKKFRYIQYSSYKLYQKDIISKFHVDFEQEVFNLYHSGNNGIGKSVVKKFLLLSLVLLVFVFIIFKVFISVFLTPDQPEKKPNFTENNSTQKEIILQKIKEKRDIEKENSALDYYYYSFHCYELNCMFENSTDSFERDLLFSLLSKTEIIFESKRTFIKGSMKHTYLIKDDVFKPLNITFKQGKTDEKTNSFGGYDLPSFGSSSKK